MTWNELPLEIQEKMLEHQVAQGNKRDPEVFIKSIATSRVDGGFSWNETPEKQSFWNTILDKDNIQHFYTLYQKKAEYPKWMMVSNDNINWHKRKVIMLKNKYYIAWYNAETEIEVEKAIETHYWSYAKDIEPENKKKQELLTKIETLTKEVEELKEIASKM